MKEYIVKGRLDNKTGFMSFTVKQELIRCRDCKYYKWEIDMCNREGATVFPMNVVHEEDYCSRAERKEE